MKRIPKLMLGFAVVVVAFFFTVVGEQCRAAGQQSFGTSCIVVGYFIPILPIYKLYSNISNKKIAGIMVVGWCMLSASVLVSTYSNVLQLLGWIVSAISSILAVYKANEKSK